MSVLCCRIPDFLFGLALRRDPGLSGRAVALLGSDERVGAASPAARQCGVLTQMTARQAQVRCPDVRLHPLDQLESQVEQSAFLAELRRWELPVEELGWGSAYVDLHALTPQPDEVRLLAAEAGQRVRATLGVGLQPALGWDTGKFTAQAAAVSTQAGTMRLVTRADEARFLAPLPVTLLPLPEAALRQLYWLGVRTLGQFAALPVAGVWQRFGQAGKLAQRLAQGQDNRPVLMTVRSAPEMVAVDVDPPGGEVKRMVAALMAAMCPVLKRLEQELAGCRRLRLRLQFVGGAERMIDIVFVEPTSQEARLRAAITERLSALIWPNNMERIECFFWEIGEQPAGQLTLFPATESDASPIDLAHKLARRYGVRFFQGALVNASHPVAGRRARLLAIG
jgi:nucleotidyltransferase/DNA polymerase involved in DNA repair